MEISRAIFSKMLFPQRLTIKTNSTDDRLRVLFLILDRRAPSSRYRVLQYLPFMERAGIIPQVRELRGGMLRRASALLGLEEFHMVFIQKRLFRLLEWIRLRFGARKVIFDFDDAIIYRNSVKGAGPSKGRLFRFKRTVRGCDLVIAGNSYLKEMTEGYTTEDKIVTIPTPIDMERYTEKNPSLSEGIRIGWIGSAGTLFYLEELYPVLREVCRGDKGVKVKVVSDTFPDWRDVPLERKLWSYEDEIQDLHSFDIGIMPLTDDPWTRGKCGFKLLQYMAVGLPVVCSPVGVNAEMVRDGINGLLARNQDEWGRCLELLISDPGLRIRLGRAGRLTVRKGYSLNFWAERLISVLRGVLQPSGPRTWQHSLS